MKVRKDDDNYAKGTYNSEAQSIKQTNKSGGSTDDSERDGQDKSGKTSDTHESSKEEADTGPVTGTDTGVNEPKSMKWETDNVGKANVKISKT